MKSNLALSQWLVLGCLLGTVSPLLCAQESEVQPIAQAEETDLPQPELAVLSADDVATDSDFQVEETLEASRTREIVAELRSRIMAEESSQDAFSNSIGELSFDLGSQLLELKLYEEALESFRRAEHLMRVNYGLYALEQVSVVEGMIQAHMGMRDWEAVDANMDRLLWLYRRNNSENSLEYLDVLADYAKYHMAAYMWDVDSAGLLHLVQAQDTLAHIADVSLARGFEYDPQLYEAISITNYSMMTYAAAGDDYVEIPALDRRVGLGTYLANAYRRGLDYLRAGREVAYRSDNIEHRIYADLILSDWYQLFFKRFEAQQHLRLAWDQARAVGLEDSLGFGQPHILPRQGYINLLPELGASDVDRQILVRLDVDQWGAPSNVELAMPSDSLVSSDLVNAGHRAIRDARQSRFRPAIIDGQPVEYTGYVHSVPVDD